MALEEEIMKADQEAAKEEEKETKNPDDLTDEEIESVKELEASAWWEVLLKCMKKRVEKQDENILVLAKDNCFNAKTEGFSFYEVLWAFTQGMGEMERLVKVITTDPEDVKKAQEAIKNAEAIMRWEKPSE
mgnify:CR=1 FL=1